MKQTLNDLVINKSLQARKLANEVLQIQLQIKEKKIESSFRNKRKIEKAYQNLKTASMLLLESSFELVKIQLEDTNLEVEDTNLEENLKHTHLQEHEAHLEDNGEVEEV